MSVKERWRARLREAERGRERSREVERGRERSSETSSERSREVERVRAREKELNHSSCLARQRASPLHAHTHHGPLRKVFAARSPTFLPLTLVGCVRRAELQARAETCPTPHPPTRSSSTTLFTSSLGPSCKLCWRQTLRSSSLQWLSYFQQTGSFWFPNRTIESVKKRKVSNLYTILTCTDRLHKAFSHLTKCFSTENLNNTYMDQIHSTQQPTAERMEFSWALPNLNSTLMYQVQKTQQATAGQMDFSLDLPTTWSLALNDHSAAVEDCETVSRKRARIQGNNTDFDGLSRNLFADFREADDPFTGADFQHLSVGSSLIELDLKEQVLGFLARHKPHLMSMDLTQQIRSALKARFGACFPKTLSTKLKKQLTMSAAVLVLIYGFDNKRDVLYVHRNPNHSTAGQTEAQIEATVRKNKVRGVMLVVRHFKVDKRSLGRSLKWALGCPSSGNSSRETFLFHNMHIDFAKAKRKLLYFGDQEQRQCS